MKYLLNGPALKIDRKEPRTTTTNYSNMHKILKLTLFVLTAKLVSPVCCFAGHAIYKSVGHQTLFGNNSVTKLVAKGFFVFDPDTGVGTAIVGFTLNGQKLFSVVPLQHYNIEHVTGVGSTTYTIIAKAESPGTQFAGILLEAVYLRGTDSLVTIDSQGSRLLPRTFTSSARAISQNTQNGVVIAGEVTGSYSLDTKGSLASNISETFDQAVTRLATSFTASGYTQFTPPPAQ